MGSFTVETASSASKPQVDTSKPADFEGSVKTTNKLPPEDIMLKIGKLELLDRANTVLKFEDIVARAERTLVIFVRHFFCGNCQDYIRSFGEEVPSESLPSNTAIVIIGCGDPELIDMYIEATGCKYPLYTDPQRHVFETLGMIKTLELGEKPKYMKRSLGVAIFSSILQGLRQIPAGLALKSGDHRQVGGEFMFEVVDGMRQVTWCHRMQTTRDHAEVDDVRAILKI